MCRGTLSYNTSRHSRFSLSPSLTCTNICIQRTYLFRYFLYFYFIVFFCIFFLTLESYLFSYTLQIAKNQQRDREREREMRKREISRGSVAPSGSATPFSRLDAISTLVPSCSQPLLLVTSQFVLLCRSYQRTFYFPPN